jgi:hypothetical protein
VLLFNFANYFVYVQIYYESSQNGQNSENGKKGIAPTQMRNAVG